MVFAFHIYGIHARGKKSFGGGGGSRSGAGEACAYVSAYYYIFVLVLPYEAPRHVCYADDPPAPAATTKSAAMPLSSTETLNPVDPKP